MDVISATAAQEHLPELIEAVNERSAPVTIAGQGANAVLVSEDDWLALHETLRLVSTPGFAESVKAARHEGGTSDPLEW
ncbi:type II toxin-antitoxin system Phd/YefM family antitoxin [Actinotignum timonense]|uniref:type II toxin-antitoxin system Phd/YefM family antitoxin n=1 Tax=Actinotignum TaxID=1653174 RepID=UPI002550F970|nr:type II toxin-antitoxin system Phd/YefM family antitoxin [Actinotignum timonense]MDK6905930.1 type II toxin-antitoxin system Phd/YefM family antitoxin [Actinotignum timonense]MDK8782454.1 type II toxin-antitoxin system Phd/YefM family antitoxin [Actinotignum timonense]MDY5138115.1 type II toxin-antitoxin system Phd/YefM family antitoxin [Actinotignum timonense]